MTDPSDTDDPASIWLAKDYPRPAPPKLTNQQRIVLARAVASLELAGRAAMSAALAEAFEITGGDLEHDREGETHDRP